MRIISGIAKGRKLFPPPLHEKGVRPTADRAREALFNIIGQDIEQATVLDLFAGTGAVGLEAFSRNAGFVVFVDNNPLALQLVKKNILHCLKGYDGDCQMRVIKHDLRQHLSQAKLPKETADGFDFIFADPPYEKDFSSTTLDFINNGSLLANNGLLVLEERHSVELPETLSKLELFEKRVYGEAAFYFYRPVHIETTS